MIRCYSMYKKGISNTREIIWPAVAQCITGTTAVFLCKIFFYLVQECGTDEKDNFAGNIKCRLNNICKKLRDIYAICREHIFVTDVVEYLYRKKIPEIKSAEKDKFLPRIIYKDGKISLLNSEDDTTDTNTVDCKADCDTDDI